VDILFNNAGYGRHRTFLEWDLDDVERMMRVNYLGSVYLTRLLLPGMVERGTGWVVFIASVAGRIGTPGSRRTPPRSSPSWGWPKRCRRGGRRGSPRADGVPRRRPHALLRAEGLARLPPVARRRIVEPEQLVDAIFGALARGGTSSPSALAGAGYVVKAVAPSSCGGR